MGEHTDDLRNVQEGDTVDITTSEGETFEAECVMYRRDSADERTGEVRITKLWEFQSDNRNPVVTILDGLKSSLDDDPFPRYRETWDQEQEETMGYITDVTIHGKMEA